MKKHLTQEELSAFLDNEHENPGDVQRHLQMCEQCAQQHATMQKLSTSLQALPLPEVDPFFARRVANRVRLEEPKINRFAWTKWGLPLASAAALILAAVISLQSARPSTGSVLQAENSQGLTQASTQTKSEDSALLQAYAQVIDTITTEEMLLDLTRSSLLEAGEGRAWNSNGGSYDSDLMELSSDEMDVFMKFLGSYTIDTSRI